MSGCGSGKTRRLNPSNTLATQTSGCWLGAGWCGSSDIPCDGAGDDVRWAEAHAASLQQLQMLLAQNATSLASLQQDADLSVMDLSSLREAV